MQMELTKLQTENNEIRSMNKGLEETRIELVTSLERMQLELRDVKTGRQTDSLSLESVENENAKLVKQVATHRTTAADLVKKIDDLQSELESKQRVIRNLEALKEIRERVDSEGCLECLRRMKLISEERQAKEAALPRVAGLQTALDREVDLSQEARALSESELEEIRTDRDERISHLERLLAQQLKDQKEVILAQWHDEKFELQDYIRKLEDENSEKRAALEDKSVQLQKAEHARIELNEAEQAMANLETAIEIREESILKLTDQLEKSRTDHQALESAHLNAQNKIASLQSVVDSLKFGRTDRLRKSEKLLEQAQAGYLKNPKHPSVNGLAFTDLLNRTDATTSLSTKSYGSTGYPVRQFVAEPTILYTDPKDPLRNNFGRFPYGDDGGDDGDPNGSNAGSGHESSRSVRGFHGARRGPSFSELLKFVPKLASTAEKTHIKLFLATVDDIRIQYGVTDLEILRIVNLRLMETTHPKISKWWADEASLTPFRSWAQAKKSLSERFAETIDSSLVEEYAMDGVQKAAESLREFAERMSFALTHCRILDDIAVKQFMLGCRDKAEISCLKNGEVPPATIRDCITFLQKRDINVDSKPNGPDPRSVSHDGSRSVRGRSPSRTDTDETLESRITNKIPQVVAMALQQSRSDPPPQTSNTIPNGSPHQTIPPPKIRSDANQKIQDSDQVQNSTSNDINLGPQTKIGFGTPLPDVYADGTDDPVPPKPPDPNPVDSDNMPRNGDTVLTQQVYPGVIASVTDERLSTSRHGKDTRDEIPINCDGSSLDPLQRELLLEFDIFATTSKAPGRTDRIKCTINTGNAAPIKSAPYRVSQCEGELMEAEIRQYEDLGLIRPSTSPWASPVLMIRKPDGSIRFCIDYRKLNDVTIKDRYPMPRVDDLLDVLGKSKYFSTMDVASGYWNVRMEEESIPKTAFVCKFGLYEWLVMPFGLCNAVPQFERLMEDVLRDQLWMSCLVYLDDVIVFSPDFATHISRLRDVLTCLQSAGFKLKMSKCHWGKTSVAFLGHIVTPAGILPNPEKVKSVLRVRPLRNVAEVRAFLGLAGYFRRFIQGFAAISRPLEKLKTAEVFEWTSECTDALENLKRKLVSPPILAYPIFEDPFFVMVDACPIAVGAVLMQRQDGRDRVIHYASQALDATQQKWIHKKDGISEIECYGVVWATKKFRPYIDRRPFTIYTDHSALVWLFKTGSQSSNGKLARWAVHLQSLEFIVVHRPGSQMGCADGLSRLPAYSSLKEVSNSDGFSYNRERDEWVRTSVPQVCSIRPLPPPPDSARLPDPRTDLLDPREGDEAGEADQNGSHPNTADTNDEITLTDIRDPLPRFTREKYNLPSKLLRIEQSKDPFIQAVKGYVLHKAIPMDPEILSILTRTGQNFLVDKKILYRRTILKSPFRNPVVTRVPVIPLTMIRTILELCHDSSLSGHFGVAWTADRVKRIGYWKGWREDVTDYCRKCIRCGAAKGSRPWKHGRMQRMPVYKLRGPISFLVVDASDHFLRLHKATNTF
ncbi:hypothetical protein AeRB84_021442 [Aphanomyces euteiches]|nr:hypothetical protein AeRB84_021442 [Aphanomyces euteiches]